MRRASSGGIRLLFFWAGSAEAGGTFLQRLSALVRRPALRSAAVAIGVLIMVGNLLHPGSSHAATLPSGFADRVVLSGLTNPSNVEFASDGRVFVAEKSGLVKVFASLTATTPTVFADLRTEVDDYWDRGLLGLALDPQFPAVADVLRAGRLGQPAGQQVGVGGGEVRLGVRGDTGGQQQHRGAPGHDSKPRRDHLPDPGPPPRNDSPGPE